jgi:Zinc carboxypeptidase
VPPSATAAPGTKAGQAQRIKHLVGNREIWFVPMLNAEGHDHTIRTSRKWRPNRFINTFPKGVTITAPKLGGGSRTIRVPAGTACTGVDVNRNYNTSTWGQETVFRASRTTSRDPRDQGDDTSFGGQIFCGMSGESESETAALAGLIRAQKFASVISYHNFSEDILAPDATFTDAFTKSLGAGMKDLIAERGISYAFKSATGLYPTTGDTLDYFIEKVPGKRPGYTIEVSPPDPPANPDHIFSGLPETEIRRVFQQNLAAALAAINCAGFPSAPTGTTTTLRLGVPPWVVTVVPNCWNRFKGWDPTI